MKRLPLVVLALALSALALPGCSSRDVLSTIARPSIQGITPRITGIDFEGVSLALDVAVENPYAVPIRTPRFRYALDIAGSPLFESDTTTRLDLPASGTGIATLPVKLRYLDIWNLYQALQERNELDYTVRGALVMNPLGQEISLPLSYSGKVPVLKVPEFRSIAAQPTEVSLTRARVRVEAEIVNPNVGAIGVADLGYALTLGSVAIGNVTATTGSSVEAGGTGRLTLTGEVSAAQAVIQMLMGGRLGEPAIVPTGSLVTPWGNVTMPALR